MMRDRIIDVVVWILIAVFGLATAYVTFGILSSQASTVLFLSSLLALILHFVSTNTLPAVDESAMNLAAMHRPEAYSLKC
jgi:hypothetical protein